MSAKQEKLNKTYNYIVDFVKKNGYSPSLRELCKAVGVSSTSTIHAYLNELEELGKIRKSNNLKRSVMPVFRNTNTVFIPVLGHISAGVPILAEENIDDYFPLPEVYSDDSDKFMLKIQGDSMINAGILDGDYIIVRQQSTAENGEIVAARVSDEGATVKTFYKEKDHIRLQPQNDAYSPIISKNVEILGKVIGVYRIM